VNQEWRKYCDAAARSGPTFADQRIGQRGQTHGHCAEGRSKAAMSPKEWSLSGGAKVLVTGKAFVAGERYERTSHGRRVVQP
jgi:hypothetical protein